MPTREIHVLKLFDQSFALRVESIITKQVAHPTILRNPHAVERRDEDIPGQVGGCRAAMGQSESWLQLERKFCALEMPHLIHQSTTQDQVD